LAAGVALQAAVLYAPPLRALFHTEPLGWSSLLWVVALGSVVLWVEELRKWWARRGQRSSTGSRGGSPAQAVHGS
jgi:hypothetical protein